MYSVLNDKFYDKFKEIYPELEDKFKREPKSFLLEVINQIQSKSVDRNKYHKTNLGVTSIKTGLPHFYSDVSSSAYILATSAITPPFVLLNFDKSQVPNYLPAREKAKESTNLKEIIDMINRVSGVKALLAGSPLESIEPVIVDDSFVYGIASQDWYIYVDGDLVVDEDIIHIDERAKEELAAARKRVEEMLPVIEKNKHIVIRWKMEFIMINRASKEFREMCVQCELEIVTENSKKMVEL